MDLLIGSILLVAGPVFLGLLVIIFSGLFALKYGRGRNRCVRSGTRK